MTTTLDLREDDGALRARLDEDEWSAVVTSTGANADQAPLRPLPDVQPSPRTVTPRLKGAAQIALGRAPIRVVFQSGVKDRGVVAQMGSNGRSVAVAVRAVVSTDDGPVASPGVELSAQRVDQTVLELLRLFPSTGAEGETPTESVVLPAEDALTVSRALSNGDEGLAAAVVGHAGHDEVPEVVRAMAAGTSGSATLSLHVDGQDSDQLRHWLLTDMGWVQLSTVGDAVSHRPQSRSDIFDGLVALFSVAFGSLSTKRTT